MASDPGTPVLPSWSQLKDVAAGQRMVIWALLGGLLALGLTAWLGGALGAGGATLAYAFTVLSIGVRIWMAFAVFQLARALGSRLALLWAVGAFLPGLIGLLVLLVLSARGTSRLKLAGLKVGLLGARLPEAPPPGFVCQETANEFA